MPGREEVVPPIKDAPTAKALKQLEGTLLSVDMGSYKARKERLSDAADKLLPPLRISASTRTTRPEAVYETTATGKELKSVTFLGETWKKDGAGFREAGTGKAVDRVSLYGLDLVLEDSKGTTIKRLDGSSVRETIGIGGSSHIVLKDKNGVTTGIIHNSREFKIVGGKVFDKFSRPLSNYTFDKTNDEITYKRMGKTVTLKADGSTEALSSAKPPVKIVAFADGSRIYKDKGDNLLGLRFADRKYIDVVRGKLVAKLPGGTPYHDHVLNGKDASIVDKKTGAARYKWEDSGNRHEGVVHLDGRKTFSETVGKDTGFTRFEDTAGKQYLVSYKPPGSRNKDDVDKITGPGGPIYEKKVGLSYPKLRIDDRTGRIDVITGDSSSTTYNLSDRTKTVTSGVKTDKLFPDGHRRLTESGRLTDIVDTAGVARTIKYDPRNPDRIAKVVYKGDEASPHTYEVGPRGVKRIEENKDVLTVVRADRRGRETKLTVKPDLQAEVLYPNGTKAYLDLYADSSPRCITKGTHPRHTIELEKKDGFPYNKVTIYDKARYDVAANAKSINVTPEGLVTVGLRTGGTSTINPADLSITTKSEKGDKISFESIGRKTRVEIEKDSKGGRAIVYGRDGKIAYKAALAPSADGLSYKVTELRDAKNKILCSAPLDKSGARKRGAPTILLEGDTITARKSGKGEVTTFNPDRTVVTRSNTHTDTRVVPGMWLKHRYYTNGRLAGRSLDIQYATDKDGDVATKRVKEGRGPAKDHALLEHYVAHRARLGNVKVDHIHDSRGDHYAFSNARGKWNFKHCSVDERGAVHLKGLMDARGKVLGRHYVLDPEEPGRIRRAAEIGTRGRPEKGFERTPHSLFGASHERKLGEPNVRIAGAPKHEAVLLHSGRLAKSELGDGCRMYSYLYKHKNDAKAYERSIVYGKTGSAVATYDRDPRSGQVERIMRHSPGGKTEALVKARGVDDWQKYKWEPATISPRSDWRSPSRPAHWAKVGPMFKAHVGGLDSYGRAHYSIPRDKGCHYISDRSMRASTRMTEAAYRRYLDGRS